MAVFAWEQDIDLVSHWTASFAANNHDDEIKYKTGSRPGLSPFAGAPSRRPSQHPRTSTHAIPRQPPHSFPFDRSTDLGRERDQGRGGRLLGCIVSSGEIEYLLKLTTTIHAEPRRRAGCDVHDKRTNTKDSATSQMNRIARLSTSYCCPSMLCRQSS
jgi:hypothetical protein